MIGGEHHCGYRVKLFLVPVYKDSSVSTVPDYRLETGFESRQRQQGRIKGFVGPRPFWRFEKYCWNYSVLSIIQANVGGGDARIIRTLYFIHRPLL
jgi:hypothetical protein